MITEDNILQNPYSWNRFANMVYIDCPMGFGLSYKINPEIGVSLNKESDNLVLAIKQFFMKFQEFKNSEYIISGEGKNGSLATTVSEKLIFDSPNLEAKFQGVFIISAALDPLYSLEESLQKLWKHKVITKAKYAMAKS